MLMILARAVWEFELELKLHSTNDAPDAGAYAYDVAAAVTDIVETSFG